jgi:hypothetical protein
VAIVKATLLAEIADDLNDFGEWDEAEDGYLERQLFKAVDDLWKAHQWAFRIGSTSLSVTSGTLGPYPVSGDLPENFEALVSEEKLNKYYAYDAYGVPPPVPDDSYGQRFPVVLDRVLNKIRFLVDPGTGTKTLYYLIMLTDLDTALALFPDKVALKKILTARTAHYALVNTEDFANQAKTYWEQSEMLLNREVKRERKGSSRPDTRTLLGTTGNPVYYGIQTGIE